MPGEGSRVYFFLREVVKAQKNGLSKPGRVLFPPSDAAGAALQHTKALGAFHFPTASQGRLLITWEGSQEVHPDGKRFWLRERAAELLGGGSVQETQHSHCSWGSWMKPGTTRGREGVPGGGTG